MTRRLTLAMFLFALSVSGQTPKFEIADVHVSAPGTSPNGGFIPGGRLEIRGVTMLNLISIAYDTEDEYVVGGPGWLSSDKFDVIAKAPAGKSDEKLLQEMVRNLLIDRFQMKAHKDKRDMPVFVLSVAKGGAKLHKAAKDGPSDVLPQDTGQRGLNRIICTSCKMSNLAGFLPESARNFVTHPVVDETGLEGAYDFQLEWMGVNVYRAAKANPDGPPAVSPFDAVEKLGLKLEQQNRPMPVVVVDSVNETPTPNAPEVTTKIPTFPTEFEAAEVRPAKAPPAPGTGVYGQTNMQNGRVEIIGATLKGLILLAYDLRPERVAITEKWMEEDRFDVIAKTAREVPFQAIQGMMKKLLADRFKLAAHTEDQTLPVWVLLAGKKPKLKESDGAARSECKIVNTDRRYFVCTNTTMAQFAEQLPNRAAAYVQPPLLDLTEIKGAYDFQLYWTPKAQLPQARDGANAPATSDAATPSEDVTVFEAVDKQLGLKLEQQKHPVSMLVIEHVERTPVAK